MKKILLSSISILMSGIISAQSIEEQARKSGEEAYNNAMIRNVLIILGVAVVYFIYKFLTKKSN